MKKPMLTWCMFLCLIFSMGILETYSTLQRFMNSSEFLELFEVRHLISVSSSSSLYLCVCVCVCLPFLTHTLKPFRLSPPSTSTILFYMVLRSPSDWSFSSLPDRHTSSLSHSQPPSLFTRSKVTPVY